jgi:hypothetical protein
MCVSVIATSSLFLSHSQSADRSSSHSMYGSIHPNLRSASIKGIKSPVWLVVVTSTAFLDEDYMMKVVIDTTTKSPQKNAT